MEVFKDWQIQDLVVQMINVTRNVSLIILGAFLALRILIEIYKVIVVENFRFSIGQFTPIFIILVAILAYGEIMPFIGDAFYHVGELVRGEGENSFKLSNLWNAVKDKMELNGKEEVSFWDVLKNFGGAVLNPLDFIQNMMSLQNAVLWQLIGTLFRLGMIFFKNIIYALLLIIGPIPLVLSIIPGLQGLAAHWMKNFLVVGGWNIVLALLDAIMDGLQFQILNDLFIGGDEELSIGFLTMVVAIMYLFVPYITSLTMGQTIVSVAGSKLVGGPVAAGLTALSVGAGLAMLRSGTGPPYPPSTKN